MKYIEYTLLASLATGWLVGCSSSDNAAGSRGGAGNEAAGANARGGANSGNSSAAGGAVTSNGGSGAASNSKTDTVVGSGGDSVGGSSGADLGGASATSASLGGANNTSSTSNSGGSAVGGTRSASAGNGGAATSAAGRGGASASGGAVTTTPRGGAAGSSSGAVAGGTNRSGNSVLQHHNHATRDGVYVDPAMTPTAVANLHVDASFAGAQLAGPTYTQPLYLAGSGSTPDLVIVATEQNHVIAFNAESAAVVWEVTLGTALPPAAIATLRAGCGNINPLGITGTPVIDEATRTIYLDAMTTSGSSASAQASAARHKVFALNADTGKTIDGWPVDLNATAKAGSLTFNSLVQNQRGALVILNGKVFIPFGGHIGDCSTYHGWVIGISTTDPTQVSAWATRALAGGVWAPGGIASDGTSLFFATGNTEATADTFTAPTTWQDGETIFKLPPSLAFSNQASDYFVPTDWAAMDRADADLGGTTPVVFDLPGATPSKLIIGLGKDSRAFLLDRTNLGGITDAMVTATVASGAIITASAAYNSPSGTFVAFKGNGRGCPSGQSGSVTALKIGAASPPTISVAWCAGPASQGSVAVSVTDTDGQNPLVWIVGSNNKLVALDGATGQTVFNGGAAADTMSAVQKFVPPIIVNGRVFVGANNQLYAFTP